VSTRAVGAVSTGIAEIDAVLPGGGLGFGKVHEWLATAPPMTLLMELARRGSGTGFQPMKTALEDGHSHRLEAGATAWIGLWPYAVAVVKAGLALSRCLVVRTVSRADRLWAIDLALRSRAAAAVVADGSGLDLSATRRLQLAAEAGGGLCLLARPAREEKELSASATRWRVECVPSPTRNRRWRVELLRCKGMRPGGAREWVVEHATGAFRVAPDLRDRPGEAAAREERLTA
jgi:protein ImuA